MSIIWISFELWNIILPISPISCSTCTLLKQCKYWNPNLKSASKLKSEWYLWYHTYTLTTFSHVQHFTCIILNRGWCDTQSSNMELELNMTLMMTLFSLETWHRVNDHSWPATPFLELSTTLWNAALSNTVLCVTAANQPGAQLVAFYFPPKYEVMMIEGTF